MNLRNIGNKLSFVGGFVCMILGIIVYVFGGSTATPLIIGLTSIGIGFLVIILTFSSCKWQNVSLLIVAVSIFQIYTMSSLRTFDYSSEDLQLFLEISQVIEIVGGSFALSGGLTIFYDKIKMKFAV